MTLSPLPHFSRPVSRIVLGSIPLLPEHPEESFELLDEYLRLGGNAVDTAHIYGAGRHRLVGEYLRSRGRDGLIVMDKCCHPMHGRNRLTREDLIADLDESQERMGIERTEFSVLHREDPSVPVEQVVDWFNEQLYRIDAFGGSNWRPERLEAANAYAERNGLQGFSLSSPNVALAFPQAEMWAGALAADDSAREWYAKTRLPVFAWSSGAHGFFAGVGSDDVQRVYFNEKNFARKARAEEMGMRKGLSPTQIALAWTLNQPLNVFAIVGPRTIPELRECMEVESVTLTPEELRWLEHGV